MHVNKYVTCCFNKICLIPFLFSHCLIFLLSETTNKTLSSDTIFCSTILMPNYKGEGALTDDWYNLSTANIYNLQCWQKKAGRSDVFGKATFMGQSLKSEKKGYETKSFSKKLQTDEVCVSVVSYQASVTNSDVIFLKLHASWDVLCRYAELMNIRMPFRWAIEIQFLLLF